MLLMNMAVAQEVELDCNDIIKSFAKLNFWQGWEENQAANAGHV